MLDPRDIERAAKDSVCLNGKPTNENSPEHYHRQQRLSLVPIAVTGWRSSSTTANHKTSGTVRPVQHLAAFAAAEAANGRDAQGICSLLAAIEEPHDFHDSRTRSPRRAVSAVLDRIVKTDPPRSWAAAERSEWARLPPTIGRRSQRENKGTSR